MKKMTLLVFTVVLISACSKKGTAPDPAQLEHYPQTWIFTQDEGTDKYIFLKTNGAVMYKDHVLRTYSLIQLAEDEECEWEISQSRTEDNSKECFVLRLDKNKNWWAGASPSSNKQEVHMTVLNASGNLDDDSYKWFVHKRPDQNGVKSLVLENVYYKGYYISAGYPGFQYAQNLVVLEQADSPEKATAWQCR